MLPDNSHTHNINNEEKTDVNQCRIENKKDKEIYKKIDIPEVSPEKPLMERFDYQYSEEYRRFQETNSFENKLTTLIFSVLIGASLCFIVLFLIKIQEQYFDFLWNWEQSSEFTHKENKITLSTTKQRIAHRT